MMKKATIGYIGMKKIMNHIPIETKTVKVAKIARMKKAKITNQAKVVMVMKEIAKARLM